MMYSGQRPPHGLSDCVVLLRFLGCHPVRSGSFAKAKLPRSRTISIAQPEGDPTNPAQKISQARSSLQSVGVLRLHKLMRMPSGEEAFAAPRRATLTGCQPAFVNPRVVRNGAGRDAWPVTPASNSASESPDLSVFPLHTNG